MNSIREFYGNKYDALIDRARALVRKGAVITFHDVNGEGVTIARIPTLSDSGGRELACGFGPRDLISMVEWV